MCSISLDACAPTGAAGLLEHLAVAVNLLAQGRACATAAPCLAGAVLVAVPKPEGGVRPIAIGEVLRRLTGKCLLETVKGEFFWPAQLGVAIPAGVEVAVHTVRAYVERHAASADRVLVKLDFENAFNTVSRTAMLGAVSSRFPHLARWVSWCYRAPPDLKFGAFTLKSAGGVQQGNPLGPLLFASTLQPLACELRAGPLDIASFFLDDGVVAGTPAVVGEALTHIQQRAAAVGLRLNLAKCEAIAIGATPLASLAPHLPRELLVSADGGSRVVRSFELLGAAVGVDERADKATRPLDAVAELEDPQVGLRLLRQCAGHARLVHGMRCTPPAAQLSALQEFDARVQSCFSGLTGLYLTADQAAQTTPGRMC